MHILLFFVLMFLPVMAEAAGAPKNLRELSDLFVSFISATTITLALAGFVIYLWGMVYDFFKLSEGESGAWRQYYGWGIAILFVMASVWGILRLMQATVFNGDVPGASSNETPPCTFNTNFEDCNI